MAKNKKYLEGIAARSQCWDIRKLVLLGEEGVGKSVFFFFSIFFLLPEYLPRLCFFSIPYFTLLYDDFNQSTTSLDVATLF